MTSLPPLPPEWDAQEIARDATPADRDATLAAIKVAVASPMFKRLHPIEQVILQDLASGSGHLKCGRCLNFIRKMLDRLKI